MDADVILLTDIKKLWNLLKRMNSKQIMSLGSDNMDPKTSYYYNAVGSAKEIPVPTRFGLNGGIFLMNLTRMRQVKFFDDVDPIFQQYQDILALFDQDIINIYLSRHPDRYLELPCNWNYLTYHCSSSEQLCKIADREGINLLHGTPFAFRDDGHPTFKAIYNAFLNYQFNTDLYTNFYQPLNNALEKTIETKMWKI